jgi:NAD(P)-dependent dehydrogenase (short-subunit alcohol dehydrogenase family)
MQLDGKRVLLTGASRGLGRALAQDLARAGAHVALTARSGPALEETAALCRAAGATDRQIIATFTADITQEEACRRLVAEATVALGGLDILVLNAGLSMWADFTAVSDLSLYEELLRTNYLSAVYLLHAALPHLRAARGRIVTISSAQAWTGLPHHTGYAASKAALQGFLDSLAMELGNEVSFLGVYPGWIRGTELRAAALGANAQPLGDARRSHSSLSVTAEACSATVLHALRKDRPMVFVPRTLRVLYALRPFAYPLIKRILTGAAGSQGQNT